MSLRPFIADPDVSIYLGDALTVLRELPDRSVHMACTSPPFFGLRDYQVEGQIGLEANPDEWTTRLVDVFREVRRVLRDDGTFWLECGDSYAANRGYQVPDGKHTDVGNHMGARVPEGIKPKDLIGQPWMLAFALRADGWFLRSCIIWNKPNAMPESAKDRPTTGHSYVFLLSKSGRYFYDGEAIREPAEWARWGDQTVPKYEGTKTSSGWMKPQTKAELQERFTPKDAAEQRIRAGGGMISGGTERSTLTETPSTKNARSVWNIITESVGLAICAVCDTYWEGSAPKTHCGKPVIQHFAAFPKELVRRMILAGTSEKGVCAECGAPWVRVLEPAVASGQSWNDHEDDLVRGNRGESNDFKGVNFYENYEPAKTLGWKANCVHELYEPIPATVIDPFGGSATTALVARELGRRSILIELNPDYVRLSSRRVAQLSLLAV